LVVDVLHAMTKDPELTDEEKKAKEEADKKAKEEADAAAAAAAADGNTRDGNVLDFNEVVTQFNETLNNFGSQLIESIMASTKEVAESNKKTVEVMDKVFEKMEEVQNTTIAIKSEHEEGDEHKLGELSKSDKLFAGTFFRTMSDFR
jgi:hypothetical protein